MACLAKITGSLNGSTISPTPNFIVSVLTATALKVVNISYQLGGGLNFSNEDLDGLMKSLAQTESKPSFSQRCDKSIISCGPMNPVRLSRPSLQVGIGNPNFNLAYPLLFLLFNIKSYMNVTQSNSETDLHLLSIRLSLLCQTMVLHYYFSGDLVNFGSHYNGQLTPILLRLPIILGQLLI